MADIHPGHRPQFGPAALVGAVVSTGEPFEIVGMETPVEAFPGGPVTQQILERMHLEKYRLDHLLLVGCLPFDEVKSGRNPPDFLVNTEAGIEGLECTVFATATRRRAYRRFSTLRKRLTESARSAPFDTLRNTVIRMSFGGGNGTPPTGRAQVDSIVEMLRSVPEDGGGSAYERSDMLPRELREAGVRLFCTYDGSAEAQVQRVGVNEIGGTFANATGFACELWMATQISRSAVCDEFVRLATQHDQPGCSHLLVTVGGPDKDGLAYPAEERLAEMLG